jgi:hypothetical protein
MTDDIRIPEYKMFIDWFGHGGFRLETSDWDAVGATTDLSWNQPYGESKSIEAVWDVTTSPNKLYRTVNSVAETGFSVSLWLYVPSDNDSVVVELSNESSGTLDSQGMVTKDAWTEVVLDAPASLESTLVTITPASAGTFAFDVAGHGFDDGGFASVAGTYLGGEGSVDNGFTFDVAGLGFDLGVFAAGSTFYVGGMRLMSDEDDVSCYLKSGESVDAVYGRDGNRDLDGIRAGDFSFSLRNETKRFTPDNPGSTLTDVLRPNREVRFISILESVEHTLFAGATTDFVLDSSIDEQAVHITANDQLARFTRVKVSTDLISSARIGDVIHEVLDQAGFTGPRDIDPGASIVRWWAAADTTVKDVLDGLMAMEGPPAVYYMDSLGGFVFRDRNHRLIRSRSIDSQATIYECHDAELGQDLWFLEDSDPEYGLSDIINQVDASADDRSPATAADSVWKSEETYTIAVGDTKLLTGTVPEGYIHPDEPVGVELTVISNAGPDETDITLAEPEEGVVWDYILVRGTVDIHLLQERGTKIEIAIENAGAEPAVVRGMQLRAHKVESESRSRKFTDDSSIDYYGDTLSLSLAGEGLVSADVEAVSNKILLARAYKLPTVSLTLVNADIAMAEEVLERNLSDRITVVSDTWFMDRDFHVEALAHKVGDTGADHRVVYSCEAVPNPSYANAFVFGDGTNDFGNGVFQSADTVTPDNVFIIGESALDSTDKLAY